MNIEHKSYDRPCALVTGATSGIGVAFASRFAQNGFDLILHGRRQKGIRVHLLTPGFTVTEFHSRLGTDFTKEQRTWMQPEEVVDKSLRALGKGAVVCIPGFKRRFIVKLASLLSRYGYHRIMKVIGKKSKKRWDEIEKRL